MGKGENWLYLFLTIFKNIFKPTVLDIKHGFYFKKNSSLHLTVHLFRLEIFHGKQGEVHCSK